MSLIRDFIYRIVTIYRFDHMISENQQLIREIDSAIRMKIAFGILLHCVVLISFLTWKERVCLLEVVLYTSE